MLVYSAIKTVIAQPTGRTMKGAGAVHGAEMVLDPQCRTYVIRAAPQCAASRAA
jgi:hypothetical protein